MNGQKQKIVTGRDQKHGFESRNHLLPYRVWWMEKDPKILHLAGHRLKNSKPIHERVRRSGPKKPFQNIALWLTRSARGAEYGLVPYTVVEHFIGGITAEKGINFFLNHLPFLAQQPFLPVIF